MTYLGIARGKTIELSEPLPFAEGESVQVSVELMAGRPVWGTPAAIRRAMHLPPHLSPQDVDALDQAIEDAKLPVRDGFMFDPGAPR